MNHKKGGRTFVIITLENLDGFFYNFCTVVNRRKRFYTYMTKMSISPN